MEKLQMTIIYFTLQQEKVTRKNNNKNYIYIYNFINKGGFGQVYRAIHKLSGMERAIKFISKKNLTSEEKKKLINEVNILKSIVN